MDASVFVRMPNTTEYSNLGSRRFAVIPRQDEYLSAEWEGSRKFFQVLAVHHSVDTESLVEIFAVQSDPPWQVRKGRAIGFGH